MRKPTPEDYGGPGHCYDTALRNWILRDNPDRDPHVTHLTPEALAGHLKRELEQNWPASRKPAVRKPAGG